MSIMEVVNDSMNSQVTQIHHLASSGEKMVERLRKKAFLPDRRKTLNLRLGIAEVARLLGCSTNRIRMAEEDGRLPRPEDGSRRAGYTVDALQNMRKVLNASNQRHPSEAPAIIAVQNFKGGVGKSTVTVHLAHYLAIQGYRILVVDCDSQATTTTLFGCNPHFDVAREQTLYPYLSVDSTEDDLNYAVQKTPWPNVDLIPSCLELFDVEYELAATNAAGQGVLADRFRKLRDGLQKTAHDHYDIILLDPPPALGMVSLSVMQAATSLLVPLSATTPDFCSTVQFLSMMDQIIDAMSTVGIKPSYNFIRLICSRYDNTDPSQSMVIRVMEETFGPSLLPVPIFDSAEISHAALRMMSVYELEAPIGAPKTHKRAKRNLDESLSQVEALIRHAWARPTSIEEAIANVG